MNTIHNAGMKFMQDDINDTYVPIFGDDSAIWEGKEGHNNLGPQFEDMLSKIEIIHEDLKEIKASVNIMEEKQKLQYENKTCKFNTNEDVLDLRSASTNATQIETELLKKSVRQAGGTSKAQKRNKHRSDLCERCQETGVHCATKEKLNNLVDGDTLITWPKTKFWETNDYTPYEDQSAFFSHASDMLKRAVDDKKSVLFNPGVGFSRVLVDMGIVTGIVGQPLDILERNMQKRVASGDKHRPTSVHDSLHDQKEYLKYCNTDDIPLFFGFKGISKPGLYFATSGSGKTHFINQTHSTRNGVKTAGNKGSYGSNKGTNEAVSGYEDRDAAYVTPDVEVEEALDVSPNFILGGSRGDMDAEAKIEGANSGDVFFVDGADPKDFAEDMLSGLKPFESVHAVDGVFEDKPFDNREKEGFIRTISDANGKEWAVLQNTPLTLEQFARSVSKAQGPTSDLKETVDKLEIPSVQALVRNDPKLMAWASKSKDLIKSLHQGNPQSTEEVSALMEEFSTLEKDFENRLNEMDRRPNDVDSQGAGLYLAKFLKDKIITGKFFDPAAEAHQDGDNFTGPKTDLRSRIKGVQLEPMDPVYGDGTPTRANDRASWFHDNFFETVGGLGLNQAQMLEMTEFANEMYNKDMNLIASSATAEGGDASSAIGNKALFSGLRELSDLGLVDLVNFHDMDKFVVPGAENIDLQPIKDTYHAVNFDEARTKFKLSENPEGEQLRFQDLNLPQNMDREDLSFIRQSNIMDLIRSDDINVRTSAKNLLACQVCMEPHAYTDQALNTAKARIEITLNGHDTIYDSPYKPLLHKMHEKDALRRVLAKPTDNNRQLFVRGLDGSTKTISFADDDTADELKARASKKLGYVPERLVSGGKQLQGSKTMSDYNIGSNSNVEVLGTLAGGADTYEDKQSKISPEDDTHKILSEPDHAEPQSIPEGNLAKAVKTHLFKEYSGGNLRTHAEYVSDHTLTSSGGLSAELMHVGQLTTVVGAEVETVSGVAIGGGFSCLPDDVPVHTGGYSGGSPPQDHAATVELAHLGCPYNDIQEKELSVPNPVVEGKNYKMAQEFTQAMPGMKAALEMNKVLSQPSSGLALNGYAAKLDEVAKLMNVQNLETSTDRATLRNCRSFARPRFVWLQNVLSSMESYASFSQLISGVYNLVPSLVNGQHVDKSARHDVTLGTNSEGAPVGPMIPPFSKAGAAGLIQTNIDGPNIGFITPLVGGKKQIQWRMISEADLTLGMKFGHVENLSKYRDWIYDDTMSSGEEGDWGPQTWGAPGRDGTVLVPIRRSKQMTTSQLVETSLLHAAAPWNKKYKPVSVTDTRGSTDWNGTGMSTFSELKCTPVINTAALDGGFRKFLFVDMDNQSQSMTRVNENGTDIRLTKANGTSEILSANYNNVRSQVFPEVGDLDIGAAATNDTMVNGTHYVISTTGTVNWAAIGATTGYIGEIFKYNNVAVTGEGGVCRLATVSINAADYYNDYVLARTDMERWADWEVIGRHLGEVENKCDIDSAVALAVDCVLAFLPLAKTMQTETIGKTDTAGMIKSRILGNFHVNNRATYNDSSGVDVWEPATGAGSGTKGNWISPVDFKYAVEMGSQPHSTITVNGQLNPSVIYKLAGLTNNRGVRLIHPGNIQPGLQYGGVVADDDNRSIVSRTSGRVIAKFDPYLYALFLGGYVSWAENDRTIPGSSSAFDASLLNSGLGNINKTIMRMANACAAIYDNQYIAAGVSEALAIGGSKLVATDLAIAGASNECSHNTRYQTTNRFVRNVQQGVENVILNRHPYKPIVFGNDWLGRTNFKYNLLYKWRTGWDWGNQAWYAATEPLSLGIPDALKQWAGQPRAADTAKRSWHNVAHTTLFNRLHPKYLAHIWGESEDVLAVTSKSKFGYNGGMPSSIPVALDPDSNSRPDIAAVVTQGWLSVKHPPFAVTLPHEIRDFTKPFNTNKELMREYTYVVSSGAIEPLWTAPYANSANTAAIATSLTRCKQPPSLLVQMGTDGVFSEFIYPTGVNYVPPDVSKGVQIALYDETAASPANDIITLAADTRDLTHPIYPCFQDVNKSILYQYLLGNKFRNLFQGETRVGDPLLYKAITRIDEGSTFYDGYTNNFESMINMSMKGDWGN